MVVELPDKRRFCVGILFQELFFILDLEIVLFEKFRDLFMLDDIQNNIFYAFSVH